MVTCGTLPATRVAILATNTIRRGTLRTAGLVTDVTITYSIVTGSVRVDLDGIDVQPALGDVIEVATDVRGGRDSRVLRALRRVGWLIAADASEEDYEYVSREVATALDAYRRCVEGDLAPRAWRSCRRLLERALDGAMTPSVRDVVVAALADADRRPEIGGRAFEHARVGSTARVSAGVEIDACAYGDVA